MDQTTASQLLKINAQFYQTFAYQFSSKRLRLQPGVARTLAGIPAQAAILDVGCGNGEVARALAQRKHLGWYIGIDASSQLLAIARQVETPGLRSVFIEADLSQDDWPQELDSIHQRMSPSPPQQFELIFAFAVFHHIPSSELRIRLLQQLRQRLLTGGLFILSVWQFLASPRLRQRLQPWDKVGLSADQVDDGDYLLDWRHGGSGLRYAHQFEPEELAALATTSGFTIRDSFYSDGENGRLGLYQFWAATDH